MFVGPPGPFLAATKKRDFYDRCFPEPAAFSSGILECRFRLREASVTTSDILHTCFLFFVISRGSICPLFRQPLHNLKKVPRSGSFPIFYDNCQSSVTDASRSRPPSSPESFKADSGSGPPTSDILHTCLFFSGARRTRKKGN